MQKSFALIREKASELGELSRKLLDAIIEAEKTEEALFIEMENADG